MHTYCMVSVVLIRSCSFELVSITKRKCPIWLMMQYYHSLIPRLLPALQCCTQKNVCDWTYSCVTTPIPRKTRTKSSKVSQGDEGVCSITMHKRPMMQVGNPGNTGPSMGNICQSAFICIPPCSQRRLRSFCILRFWIEVCIVAKFIETQTGTNTAPPTATPTPNWPLL